MTRTITIVGGGLAGLTLGIGLRRAGVPVTLWEATRYPRQRVCGEFVSGHGIAALERLGLRARLEKAGAIPATTAAFFSPQQGTATRALPYPALCLSRAIMDQELAEEFRGLGGQLRAGERWPGADYPEGVVRATGRRLREEAKPSPWFGLKIHARNVTLAADLEMHFTSRGYVGLCRLADEEVNICGLIRREAGGVSGDNLELLRGESGSLLAKRLEAAIFVKESFCAVAGLSLQPYQASQRPECCVGDAVTMIPPLTGNGMSMAFEAAEMAVGPLTRWSQGAATWEETRRGIARDCDRAFERRLRWARWLQRLVFMPASRRPLFWLAGRGDFFWRFWFQRTR